jgi:hypothetical protein
VPSCQPSGCSRPATWCGANRLKVANLTHLQHGKHREMQLLSIRPRRQHHEWSVVSTALDLPRHGGPSTDLFQSKGCAVGRHDAASSRPAYASRGAPKAPCHNCAAATDLRVKHKSPRATVFNPATCTQYPTVLLPSIRTMPPTTPAALLFNTRGVSGSSAGRSVAVRAYHISAATMLCGSGYADGQGAANSVHWSGVLNRVTRSQGRP